MNASYKQNIGDVIQSGKFAIDSMNHENTEKKSIFKRIFSRKSKANPKKGKFNTLGKPININENIATFKKSDPAVDAGVLFKKDLNEKLAIDNFIGINGFVKNLSGRPTEEIQ